ncbi:Dehydrogenase/reductase SDR family member 11 [Cryptotermes secundus]|uniref:Dehydrogenase/reductase SDR family member 11 n=1 Tax=Cryptotermes secundus TaxID=105785 RepID=A0A2J7PJT2_9NEOP|nr:dehydrogenase/reductase SDR family member 11 [Cryptotermes secundus]XP_023723998.1 dehydrogenase/reductase SDR family member 11 [Cryptotermes secundus]PNF16593.1 Dehydrogenase/reductase SDR family member 11 [Cryptotermes secundus]
MERWSGRVAVVTGANSGIGAAIAQALVKKGLKVVGLDIRVDKIQEMANSLKSEPGKLHPLKCDVTKESDVKEAFKWVNSKLGGADIHVNNAGVADYNTLTDGPWENWRKIIDVNVLGYSLCAKEALQSMRGKGVDDGHIININSETAHIMPPAIFMYAASKHAVTVLTEGLRRELVQQKSKIRVTSISPGCTRTALTEGSKVPEEVMTLFKDLALLEPEEIANALLYVLGTPPHVQVVQLTVKPNGPTI